jgi:methionine-gamma-lyase
MERAKGYREREISGRPLRPESLMMSYGYDPLLSEGSVKCPVFLTSTFAFKSAEEGKAFFELAYGIREKGPSEEPGLIYSRINNPDLEILEDRLALWDDAESALTFASGMAAISTTLLTFLRPGDLILHSEPIYGGTEFLIRNILPSFGIHGIGFTGEEGSLEDAVRRAAGRGRIGMIFLETPANPTNTLFDIEAAARISRSLERDGHRPPVAVDNTFLGPLWQQPLRHGADLVLYSLTKYVGGHSDLIAGACLGSEALLSSVRGMRTIMGTMADPWTGWLLMRSLETLAVRFERQVRTAQTVAEYLRDHPRVTRVHYLGFLPENDPQYAIYRRQCQSAGATFSFEIDGGEAEAFRVLNSLKLAKLAVSLGGTESLAEHPATMTHSDIPKDAQRRMGITPAMIRLSVGLEHPEDIVADLEQALGRLEARG